MPPPPATPLGGRLEGGSGGVGSPAGGMGGGATAVRGSGGATVQDASAVDGALEEGRM